MHMQENTRNKHEYRRKGRKCMVFTSFFCMAKSSKNKKKHEIGGVAGRRLGDGRVTAERRSAAVAGPVVNPYKDLSLLLSLSDAIYHG